MCNQPIDLRSIFEMIFQSQKVLRILFLSTFCFAWLNANSQTNYYFTNEISAKGGIILYYKTLLTIQADGTATARVQYNTGANNKLFLYQVALSDSSLSQTDTTRRYLIPNAEPIPLLDKDSVSFFLPRFIFIKKDDNTGSYYEPSGVEVRANTGDWQSVKTTLIQQKTYEDLRSDEPFLSSFYFESDEFYNYVFGEKMRGAPLQREEKMFLILVTNTNDETVGKSAKTDLKNLSVLFTKLAQNLGITKIIPLYVSGDNFSKSSVLAVLNKLEEAKPSAIDIVIFYYSGHGFRLPGDKSTYPNISFRTAKDRADNVVGDYMPLEDIYKRINALKPNVCLVLGDCCNANIYENPVLGPGLVKLKGGGVLGNFNFEAAKKLFLPSLSISMIMGSVAENHLSIGNPEIGGYFTHYFTAELEKNLWGYYNNNPFSVGRPSNFLWLQMFLAARTNTYWKSKSIQCGKTTNDRCIQQAVIDIIPK